MLFWLALSLWGHTGWAGEAFQPVRPAEWVDDVTRMVFVTPGEIELAEKARAQVVHTNICWPYWPLRRDGGGLGAEEARKLKDFVAACHRRKMRIVLGLPPFMPAGLVRKHPDWRVHPDPSGAILKVEPREDDLGTRSGCSVGPWGDYLIELLAEMAADYGLDGYSFDGNYHPPLCCCPACKAAYQKDRGRDLPGRIDLDDLRYREYLVWRGERLEDHFRRMQARLKAANPEAAIISWTANAGRYGHLLTSPRVMSTRMNLLLDMPMQEWWLDETNLGSSVAPAFGAAYIRGIMGGRPNASEPYLMSRGDPYSSDSFPRHERITRALLTIAHGSQPPQAVWLGDGGESMAAVFAEVSRRERWLLRAQPMPWAAMLTSEQTRQFYAYGDLPERFLPHVYGAFRAALEEHLPLDLVNDWDLEPQKLGKYRVLVLPGAAALSDAQAEAVRRFVRGGGGLVATCETSLCDELGRLRRDFALADVLGVSYRGTGKSPSSRPASGAGGVIPAQAVFWGERLGVTQLSWGANPLGRDAKLAALVPSGSATFKGPLVAVGEPADAKEVVARFSPGTPQAKPLPGIVVRTYGKGRVVYFAAGVDAALWSYGYPYQRRLLAGAIELAAGSPPPIRVEAPMCVQATFFEQSDREGRRTVIHLFNGLNTTGGHGLPRVDVPLREEAVPIHGIRVRLEGRRWGRLHVEPGGLLPQVRKDGAATIVELPPLAIHAMLVAEQEGE
jgi:hypothetical protein